MIHVIRKIKNKLISLLHKTTVIKEKLIMQWVKSNMAETEAMFRSQQHAIISGNYKLYDKKRGDTHRVVCYMSDGTVGEGLADRLRTILTSFVFAEVHGRPFYLFHDKDFKLEEYLEPNEVDWRIEREEINFGLNRVAFVFHWRGRIPVLKYPEREYHMYAAQTLVNLSTPQELSDKYTDGKVFRKLFKLSDGLANKVDGLMKSVGLKENEYIVFHLRFLNFFDQVEIDGEVTSTPEEREQMLKRVHATIGSVRAQWGDKKILLFSDSPTFLSAPHPDYIQVLPGKVGHVAKHGKNSEVVEKTFLDLIIMSRAATVYSIIGPNIYGGGFSREAALIADKPYEKIPLLV